LADAGQDDDSPVFDRSDFGKRLHSENEFSGFKF